ncbi:hypothetical protein D3C85_1044580 [compost metagenome]
MRAKRQAQVFHEQAALLIRLRQHRGQHLRQMRQHGVALSRARQQAADARAAVLVVDAFDERARQLDQHKVETAVQVSAVIVGEIADIDRPGIEIMGRCVVALQDAAAVSALHCHAHQIAPVGRGRGHVPKMFVFGAFAIERQAAAFEMLVQDELAGGTPKRVGRGGGLGRWGRQYRCLGLRGGHCR